MSERKSDLARMVNASASTGEANPGRLDELPDLLGRLGSTILVRLYRDAKRI